MVIVLPWCRCWHSYGLDRPAPTNGQHQYIYISSLLKDIHDSFQGCQFFFNHSVNALALPSSQRPCTFGWPAPTTGLPNLRPLIPRAQSTPQPIISNRPQSWQNALRSSFEVVSQSKLEIQPWQKSDRPKILICQKSDDGPKLEKSSLQRQKKLSGSLVGLCWCH